jgi:hypothetical protein
MSNKKYLCELPVPSTDLVTDAILCGNVIRYSYLRDGIEWKGGLIFNNVKAKRTRSDDACTAWHIEEAYDTLVEIGNSPWVNEIMADTQDRQQRFGQTWSLHHYLIYLDGSGCIEVLSESWNELPEERGAWT